MDFLTTYHVSNKCSPLITPLPLLSILSYVLTWPDVRNAFKTLNLGMEKCNAPGAFIRDDTVHIHSDTKKQ